MNLKRNSGFTLIEVMVAVMLMAIVLIGIYSVFQAIMLHQIRLQTEVDLHTHAYYATEKFVTLVEDGGTIDYEEHWNRKVRGDTRTFDADGNYSYTNESQFGNTSAGFIYCGSNFQGRNAPNEPGDAAANTADTDNCFTGLNNRQAVTGNSIDIFTNQTLQKYGQYRLFHIDVNADQDANYGEQDYDIDTGGWANYNPLETEGIAQIGYTTGPSVLTWAQSNSGSTDIYLTRETSAGQERTFFRHIFRQDPFNTAVLCNWVDVDTFLTNPLASNYGLLDGCLGTIQIAKLIAIDEDGNGRIDWWAPHPEYGGRGTILHTTGSGEDIYSDIEWVDIFPAFVNVLDARFYIHPEKDQNYIGSSGAIATDANLINPYVDIKMTLGIGGEKAHIFENLDPLFQFHTTVNLQ